MRAFITEQTEKHALSDVRCNVCGREVIKDASGYFEDHISLTKAWGYHSPYDGEIHGIDICIDCYQSWIATFEIPPEVSYYCVMNGASLQTC